MTLVLATAALVGATILPPGAAAAEPASSGELVKVIVTFKARPGAAARQAATAAGAEILRGYSIIPSVSLELPAKAINALRMNPLVASVERDGTITALDHIGNTGDLEYENAWGVEHIGTKPVHDAGIKGQGIKVAIIDTGIDYIHDDVDDLPYNVDPEFFGNYRGGYDFFNNDADPLDDNGHGTHVAGILAAEKNGYLVVGVAPEVDLYALKVLGADGSGEYSGLIAALEWAIQNDMDVVNMSLGGHDVSPALQSAIQAAYAAGITLVAASGNATTIQDLINGCPVAYPAAYDQVIAVSFTDTSDKLTGFSCTGPQVDLAAPGNQIVSTVPTGSCMFCAPQGYRAESGTSMASPHVAGVAALVLSKGIANGGDPMTLADDVKAHLCATASLAGMAPTDPRYPIRYGCGIVDARQALIVSPPPPPVGGNQPPVAVDDSATMAEDSAADVDVLANDSDVDGNPLTVTSLTAPSVGVATINPSGTVHYVPNGDANGTDQFDYRVADGAGGTDTGTVTVTVSPVNDPPIAVDDDVVTTLDTPLYLSVLANDIDPDDDPLILVEAADPPNGSATVEADGSITYFPDPGYQGSDGFDYTISDGAGGTDIGQVTVSVVPVNHPPVAVDDSLSTAEDTSASLDPLANDTDPDGGSLVLTEVTQPAHGSATLLPDGSVSYTPAANYHGPDAFGYTVDDGAGATANGSISITVTPVNDAPVAVNDVATTPEDNAVNLAVAANDTDVDGDGLAAVGIGQVGVGTAVVETNGTITYTPPANFVGPASFSYLVSDGNGGTGIGQVTITVSAVNDPPTAGAASVTTPFQTQVTVQLSGRDVETCQLTFQVVSPPSNGTLSALSTVACVTGTVPHADYSRPKYTPAAGFAGTDSFTYRVSDGTTWSQPATVSLTVTDPALIHVGDLSRTKTTQATTWTPKVTVRVHDAAEQPVNRVIVVLAWDINGTTVSCTTNTGGFCQVARPGVPRTTTIVTFTVLSLSLQTGVYQPWLNHDPDGDSNGTTIQVFGP
jgi:subtilisin family serine protease